MNILERLYELFFMNQWYLIYKSKDNKWIKLEQPNISRADPFCIYKDNKYYVFFEEFDNFNGRGYLCVGELDTKKNTLKNTKIVLKKDYHLSFPNVFEYNNKFYMIPESGENKTIDLYEFEEFPYKVKKIKTLVYGDFVDSVILQTESGCFLFSNKKIEQDDLHAKNLTIFYAKNLLNDDFKLIYSKNGDKEFCRMGGNFFEKDGILYRVSQDCKKRYGYKINIMKVLKLNNHEYEEELYKYIYPPMKKAISFHTYSKCNNLEIADIRIRKLTFKSLINGFKRGSKFLQKFFKNKKGLKK